MLSLNGFLFDGLNERRLTKTDLETICERDRVTIVPQDVTTSFYMSVMNRHFVVIPKRLRGLKCEFVIWHEIGHHLLHGGRDAGTQAFWFGLLEPRKEAEASSAARRARRSPRCSSSRGFSASGSARS